MNYLKKLDEYFIMIEEAFDNPLPISWITKDNLLLGAFKLNNNLYTIKCKNYGDNFWSFRFDFFNTKTKQFSTELTNNNKDVFRVLPTIKQAFYHLYDTTSPICIIFGAVDKSSSRRSIYLRFAKQFCNEKNWLLLDKTYLDMNLFSLYANNIDLELLYDKIKIVVEDEKFGES
jgi:hypothetical protein